MVHGSCGDGLSASGTCRKHRLGGRRGAHWGRTVHGMPSGQQPRSHKRHSTASLRQRLNQSRASDSCGGQVEGQHPTGENGQDPFLEPPAQDYSLVRVGSLLGDHAALNLRDGRVATSWMATGTDAAHASIGGLCPRTRSAETTLVSSTHLTDRVTVQVTARECGRPGADDRARSRSRPLR